MPYAALRTAASAGAAPTSLITTNVICVCAGPGAQVQSVTESRLYKSFGRWDGGLAQAASAGSRRLLQNGIDARQPVVTPIYNGQFLPKPF